MPGHSALFPFFICDPFVPNRPTTSLAKVVRPTSIVLRPSADLIPPLYAPFSPVSGTVSLRVPELTLPSQEYFELPSRERLKSDSLLDPSLPIHFASMQQLQKNTVEKTGLG